jgi:hypothetical protein
MRGILVNDLAARGWAETLEGLLFAPRAVPPSGDPELAELVSLANDLRDSATPGLQGQARAGPFVYLPSGRRGAGPASKHLRI